ncbi:MAG: LysM domain-containing protein [Candidatus Limnocylindrales bacterium]|jgi:LysM repeat protein
MNKNEPTNISTASDKEVLDGVRRRLTGVERLVPVPPAWQPEGTAAEVAGSEGRMNIHVRPAGAIGLGGVVAVTVVAVIVGLSLAAQGPRQSGGVGPTESPASPSPTISASTPTAAVPTFQVYRIQEGDTLASIAARFGITLAQLKAANPWISVDHFLLVGDTLDIPWPAWIPPTPAPGPTPTAAGTFEIYTVKNGDSMQAIASKFGITLAQLKAANPQIKNPNYIQVGQVIYIPWPSWVPPDPAASGG